MTKPGGFQVVPYIHRAALSAYTVYNCFTFLKFVLWVRGHPNDKKSRQVGCVNAPHFIQLPTSKGIAHRFSVTEKQINM